MSKSPNPPIAKLSISDSSAKNLALLTALTAVAFLVMGYHPGLEDDAFYLAAIKRNLNPALFPHDSEFFRLQFQATIFDKLIAFSVRLTHLPLAWTVLLWQFAAIFLLLHGVLAHQPPLLYPTVRAMGRGDDSRASAHPSRARHRAQSRRSIPSSAHIGDGSDSCGYRCRS